jgi:hypothetical protein
MISRNRHIERQILYGSVAFVLYIHCALVEIKKLKIAYFD